jgi:hypothetical protein
MNKPKRGDAFCSEQYGNGLFHAKTADAKSWLITLNTGNSLTVLESILLEMNTGIWKISPDCDLPDNIPSTQFVPSPVWDSRPEKPKSDIPQNYLGQKLKAIS